MKNFIEQSFEIKSKFMLRGTLSIPKEKTIAPAILILPGSGTADRDGNIPKKKLFMNIYKELAHFLASLGFVVLRYDKRGSGESEGDAKRIGLTALVEDACAAVSALKQHPNVDQKQILALGHSEGCTVAAALNEKYPLQGLILIAGAAEKMQDSLKRQRNIAYEEMLQEKGWKGSLIKKLNVIEKNEKKVEKLFAKMMETDQDFIRQGLFVKMPAKYFREMFSYDVEQALQKVECPVFAATGAKDSQVDPENLNKLPQLVKGEVETHFIEGMNHFLRQQEGPMTILHVKKELAKWSKQPISEELLRLLKIWLEKHFYVEGNSNE